MSKQAVIVRSQSDWRKWVAALILAAALTGLPIVAASVPGPLSSLFVQTAYAGCQGGSCG